MCLALEPEVIPLIAEPKIHLIDDRSFDPTKLAWVSVGSDIYAIGSLAREEYSATIPLVKPKINYLIPRVAATVAAYAYYFKVLSFELNLNCLLPPLEYRNLSTGELESVLGSALEGFSSSVGQIQASLKELKIQPEGMGLLNYYYRTRYRENFPRAVSVVLFGHRNVSLFELRDGRSSNFQSCHLGFASISSKLADALDLPERVCLAKSSSLATDERSRDVIKSYWYSVASWLTEHLPSDTQEVVIGGGAAIWLEPEIVNFFSQMLPPLPGKNYPGIFFDGTFKDWPPEINLNPSLRVRFADSYLNWKFNYAHQKRTLAPT
jgi:hypothetical protein